MMFYKRRVCRLPCVDGGNRDGAAGDGGGRPIGSRCASCWKARFFAALITLGAQWRASQGAGETDVVIR